MGNSASHAHESLDKGFTRGTFGDVKNTAAASFRFSKRSPKKMDRLRRSFRDSFRRRKDRVPESSKPHQWHADDQAVRSATCSFPVKYLGCVEVFESRGMQVCEEALKVLRTSRRRAIRGLLHVSGDGLRVVDDDTKGLIVDQTIEKVSFCAPDRNHERGFSYICRDGTTRRWMCHGFLASKDSGERLSHAVGCAFAVCLERKQRRDTECGVTMTFDMKNSTFTRSGSFRTQTMTERLQNGQNGNGNGGLCERGVDIGGGGGGGANGTGLPSAIVAPQPKPHNPFAIERPHVTPMMMERLERQGSFRAVSNQSPFKRQLSLRISDLPSNAERQKSFLDPKKHNIRSVSPIPEVSPHRDTVAQLCAELSQGLSLMTSRTDDDLNFNNTANVNQNTGGTVSLIHSPLSPPVVSVFPPLSATLAGIGGSLQPSPTRSSPDTTPLKPMSSSMEAASSAAELPRPDQWLAGQIVSGSGTSPAARRPPQLSVHSRTQSLNASNLSSGRVFGISPMSSAGTTPVGADPFDAEWVAGVARLTEAVAVSAAGSPVATVAPTMAIVAPHTSSSGSHHTNPFISPPKPPAQSFQVQL